MPIIARSEPIKLELGTPALLTPAPVTPTPIVTPSNVLERHRQFIMRVDALQACFVKTDLPGFPEDEFNLHLQIAKMDKYVTDAGAGIYCSKAAVSKLSKALERQGV